MSEKYSHSDLRRLIAEPTNFTANPQSTDPFFVDNSPAIPLLVLSEGFSGSLLHFDGSNTGAASAAAASPSAQFLKPNKPMESKWPYPQGKEESEESNENCRWPRQETLTLLQIRCRLHSNFKHSHQKAPLWDQLSRIMVEEYGYKRSGKKCKEKLDNLYKYYKKTKEGKAGRHDGKNYRFFRQLEAIYGECSDQFSQVSESNTFAGNYAGTLPQSNEIHLKNQEPNNDQKNSTGSLSFSISSDFETSSSGNYHDDDLSAIAFMMNRKKKENVTENESGKKWKKEVGKVVDLKLNKLMEAQEKLMENLLANVESRERERAMRDEEWRKREKAKFDWEMNEFCARERTWLEARETALMEIMRKFAGKE